MGIIDQLRDAIRRITTSGTIENESFDSFPSFSSPEEDDLFTRKFVAGLFYCGGKKKSYYALTFEQNDIDRELELIEFLESEISDRCSDMRDNRGYSQEPDFEDGSPVYPEIEVGIE